MSAEIRYDPASPPLALLAAVEALQAHAAAAGHVQPAAASASAPTPVHVKVLPVAGTATPTLTLPDVCHVLSGSSLLLRYVARVSAALSSSGGGCALYGCGPSQHVQVDFFLDLAPQLAHKDTLNEFAKLLNAHLAPRTWLVHDTQLTVADLACWEHITANPRWNAFTKANGAAQFPHLFRWVHLVSNHPIVAPAIAFRTQNEKKRAEAKQAKASEGAGFDVELPGAEDGKVVTRFPPEPSGYLHIGHAKAALLNDAIAKKYHGRLILRFDDTNPQKEKEEYVENIMRDLKTLGVEHHVLSHTSDHFELILNYATQMIKDGLAYVDPTPVEQQRKWRMDGVASPARTASVEENLRLWKEMQEGSPEGLKCCLRAKIDMSAGNKTLRDPTIARCNVTTPHHRTGTKFKVYPTYDLACPIVDSIEGCTHVLRTDEYRDRNEQFNWFCDVLKLRRPRIRDYSRLNFVYTVLSKRKLQWFVDTKRVDGWTDPRFPTIQGIIRRGMTVAALREFILGQGFSMSANIMEWDKIWTINKRHIDPIAPRYTGITAENQALLVLSNFEPADEAATGPTLQQVDLHPKNPNIGTKIITKSARVLLEQDDAKLIKEGEEVTLMSWGNVIVSKITRNAEGIVTRLDGALHLSGDPKTTEKKLTWLDGSAAAQADAVALSFIELDTLVTLAKVEEGVDFESIVNPQTKFITPGVGESAMRRCKQGDIVQIQRRGFFRVDQVPCVGGRTAAAATAATAGSAAAAPASASSSSSAPAGAAGASGAADLSGTLQLIFIPDGRMKAMSTLSTKVDKAKTFGAKNAPSGPAAH